MSGMSGVLYFNFVFNKSFLLIGNEGISEEKLAKKMPETALGHSMMDSALALGRSDLKCVVIFY